MGPARLTLLPAIFALSGFVSPTCLGALSQAFSPTSGTSAQLAQVPVAGSSNLAKNAIVHHGNTHLVIHRSADGLFYLTAAVKGVPVRFLIDTGSSAVILAPHDAKAIGLDRPDMVFDTTMSTAGGKTRIAWANLASVQIGAREIKDLGAAVVQDGLPVSLMGQSVLSQLGVITIDGDQLRVN